ncbi:hypothetical protein JTB14_011085 [Gonioctena quinquepunctata]|nr:hypothetical protein JTB14_011085 [Gonioctena quinquepunctata]
MEMTSDFVRNFRKSKYNNLTWSDAEKVITSSRNFRNKVFPQYTLTFSNTLLLALRKSLFRCYLDVLNPQQTQSRFLNENKLGITEYLLKNMEGKEKRRFEDNNRLFEDTTDILEGIVNDYESVDIDYLRKTSKILRIIDYYINVIDNLRKFSNLQILILSGNNIRDIPGAHLPRNLKFLELYDNFIEDLSNFVVSAPKRILHLGLGRNKLNDNSSCHLLVEIGNFNFLKTLDLSDNDICGIKAVIANYGKTGISQSSAIGREPCLC